MKIFVTGATGFVGRHLVRHLLDREHSVTSAVRVSGSALAGSEELVIGSIGPDSDWSGLLQGHDVVIHLAARVHVMNDTSEDPLEEFRRVNAQGAETLARAAAEQAVSRFVFLSSIKVNGEGTSGTPYTAHDEPDPADPYGLSKLEAEVALEGLHRETGLDVVIARTPLVYGPGVGGNFIKMLDLAARELPLPLARVRNRRTMTSIWNLVDLLERAASEPEAANALVLAGDGFSPSTPEMFREISSALGKKSRLFPFPVGMLKFAGAITGRSAVINRLVGSLEMETGSCSTAWVWRPVVSFQDSMRRTAHWYASEESAQGTDS
jgi:UDP-glucose 4-epimerase